MHNGFPPSASTMLLSPCLHFVIQTPLFQPCRRRRKRFSHPFFRILESEPPAVECKI